jgi:hypothetical protein
MMNLLKNKIAIFLYLVVAATMGGVFLLQSGGNPIPRQAKGEVREAYAFAAKYGGVLEQVPCYCGCHRSDHRHNRHCFYDDNGKPDEHGLNCGVCVDIALTARDMHIKGSSAEEMRRFLAERYRGFTPTKIIYD